MKNQYFGDENDYQKYGLLRAICGASGLSLLVAWMLTPDDSSTNGRFTTYLQKAESWRGFDAELFDALSEFASSSARDVRVLHGSSVLPGASYFQETVPDGRAERSLWSRALLCAAEDAELVFLDPDNGLEVRSTPIGTSRSSKFLAWSEVESLSAARKSLLIYQHFPREPRAEFISRIAAELYDRTRADFVEVFKTTRVAFFLAATSGHAARLRLGVDGVRVGWRPRIEVAETGFGSRGNERAARATQW